MSNLTAEELKAVPTAESLLTSIQLRLRYLRSYVRVTNREREFAVSGTYSDGFLAKREQYRLELETLEGVSHTLVQAAKA